MRPQNQKQLKWIGLGTLILFILGGGIYQYRSRSGSGEPTTDSASSQVEASEGSSSDSSVAAGGAMKDATGQGKSSSARGGSTQGSAKGAGSGIAVGAPSATGVGIGTPGVALGTGAGAGSTSAADQPQDSCFTLAFRHKAHPSHTDEETCSQHKNWLKLKHKDVNPKSICVRVNGTPVHYVGVKDQPDELVFGSVAGPKSKITVRYCLGKAMGCAQIKEDCSVPKDEFMEAIGGSNGASGDARLGQWDPKNPSEREADVLGRLDGDLRKELETNDELNGRAPTGEMFKDWLAENEISACGVQQASK